MTSDTGSRSNPMTRGRFHALSVGAFPVLLATGILFIPVVSDYSNHLLAEQAASHTGRWFWGHLICAVAFGISILAAYSINHYLFSKALARFRFVSLSLITIGAALYAFGLGADGIGPLASMFGGSRALAYFEGSSRWISGVFVSASIVFGFGLIAQAIGVIEAGLLKGITRIIVFAAAIIFIGVGAIPSGWGLYGIAFAAMLVYIPIAIAIWPTRERCGLS